MMAYLLASAFPPGLFTASFMVHAFVSGTAVAVGASLIGFFVVLRNSAFVAHALPQMGFAGAAGSLLLGWNPLIGLVVFSLGGAMGIGWLGRRGRHDTVTALMLVLGLGTGALFLTLDNDYASGAYALLFGQLVGVSAAAALATAILTGLSIVGLAILYRPLLYVSVLKSNAQAHGISAYRLEIAFLLSVGIISAVTVPMVGVLLSFSLMIGPAAAARYIARSPGHALIYSALIAVVTVWVSIILAYDINWPIGFFVAAISAFVYGLVRILARGGKPTSYRASAANPVSGTSV